MVVFAPGDRLWIVARGDSDLKRPFADGDFGMQVTVLFVDGFSKPGTYRDQALGILRWAMKIEIPVAIRLSRAIVPHKAIAM